ARSYGIPGSYAPTGSEKWLSFLRLLKNNGFKEGTGTKILLDAIETATPLESNKSHAQSIPGQDALPCAFEAVLDSTLFVTLPEPTGFAMSLRNTLGSACIGLAACARA
ncbi:MAG TPA: hypothetical protein VLQ80_19295, partial [Candidatus Saccharimonadia bacterium]|nr:hypothetical protein [Candidatus Saccharimonadia bacterium]